MVNIDQVPHKNVHDIVRLNNHGDTLNHVLNQHDVDNDNDVVVDDGPIQRSCGRVKCST